MKELVEALKGLLAVSKHLQNNSRTDEHEQRRLEELLDQVDYAIAVIKERIESEIEEIQVILSQAVRSN